MNLEVHNIDKEQKQATILFVGYKYTTILMLFILRVKHEGGTHFIHVKFVEITNRPDHVWAIRALFSDLLPNVWSGDNKTDWFHICVNFCRERGVPLFLKQ